MLKPYVAVSPYSVKKMVVSPWGWTLPLTVTVAVPKAVVERVA